MNQSTLRSHRFFDGNGAAAQCIRGVLRGSADVRIATAYFEPSGYQALDDALTGATVRLFVGRPEGGADSVRALLDDIMRDLATAVQRGSTRFVRRLLDALDAGQLAIGVGSSPESWIDARYAYHHAKLYIADRRAVVVTSANCSRHGLCVSREAGYVVTEPDDIAFFVERFDSLFAQAQSITAEVIERLRRWLNAYPPYTIYARALLALYALPDEHAPPSALEPLARYQRPIAASALRSLRERRGAFLIASTGLGKTVIAAHVAAYLRAMGDIDRALVICPAGIRDAWERWLRQARVSCRVFSYAALRSDRRDNRETPLLERELHDSDSSLLIILDESHRLRNDRDSGSDLIRRSHHRIQAAVARGARVLLLTATPYSKDVDDVRVQARLLPPPEPDHPPPTPLGLDTHAADWSVAIHQVGDLADVPVCTILNTPDVARHFGEQDDAGERFVRFGDAIRYFPRRVRLISLRYANPFDDLFAALLERRLLDRADESTPHAGKRGRSRQTSIASIQGVLPDLMPTEPTRPNPLQEALFLHQFCSSPARARATVDDMRYGRYSYRFARQEELRRLLDQHYHIVERHCDPRHDPKLQALARLIVEHAPQKIVVFCEYHDTARALAEGLRAVLPDMDIRATVECNNNETALDDLLRAFAPVANDVPEHERGSLPDVRVLVATNAINEGFNLQDAAILVNYDLPWTALALAQRMGRVLRPWHEPRDILVYTFLPSTMEDQRIRHAIAWLNRLRARASEHQSLARIPVLDIHQRSMAERWERAHEMCELANALFAASESDLSLDDVMTLLEQTQGLPSSAFYTDLANIPNPREAQRLPLGIRSAMQGDGPRRLFVLLRYQEHYVPLLADADGVPLRDSRERDRVMQRIRCSPDTPRAPIDCFPDDDDFDDWIAIARQRWAEMLGIAPEKAHIVCALAIA